MWPSFMNGSGGVLNCGNYIPSRKLTYPTFLSRRGSVWHKFFSTGGDRKNIRKDLLRKLTPTPVMYLTLILYVQRGGKEFTSSIEYILSAPCMNFFLLTFGLNLYGICKCRQWFPWMEHMDKLDHISNPTAGHFSFSHQISEWCIASFCYTPVN